MSYQPPRHLASLITVMCGVTVLVGFSLPAQAAAPAASGSARTCAVQAVRYVQHGDTRVVTAARVSCRSAATASPAGPATKMYKVGYGCKLKDF